MKISFSVNDVLSQLAQVSSVCNPKAPIQILSDIVLKTFKDKTDDICLMITGSDGETFVSMKASCNSDSDEDFVCALNAKDFVSTLRNLSGQVVTIECDEQSHTCKGRYSNGHFTMPYDDADSFPVPVTDKEANEMIVDAQRLLAAIASTEYAVATDELRPIMNGVHFDMTDKGLVVVATDGMKLSKYTDELINCNSDGEMKGFTLPSKPAHLATLLLSKREGDVKLSFGEKGVVISCSDFRIIARIQEGRYPNYNSVIPTANDLTPIVKKEDLLGALNRVMPMGSVANELVALTFENGKLTINAEDIDYSKSATENIDCEYNGEKFAIGFKGSCLYGVAQKINGDRLKFKISAPTNAALVVPIEQGNGVEYISLLMPMLLNV